MELGTTDKRPEIVSQMSRAGDGEAAPIHGEKYLAVLVMILNKRGTIPSLNIVPGKTKRCMRPIEIFEKPPNLKTGYKK